MALVNESEMQSDVRPTKNTSWKLSASWISYSTDTRTKGTAAHSAGTVSPKTHGLSVRGMKKTGLSSRYYLACTSQTLSMRGLRKNYRSSLNGIPNGRTQDRK